MATRNPKTTTSAAPVTVIRAEPGKPWPEPPAGGKWLRNPDTGDLTLAAGTEEARARAPRADGQAEAPAAAPAPASTTTSTTTPQE